MKNNYQLKIGWLYPQLMSTYGDRGNILVLQKRCTWRGIETEILEIDQDTKEKDLETIDLLFGGGAQDREQEIVIKHLFKQQKTIHKLIENNIPTLFVCGAPQLMGTYYEPAEGKRIEGLGIFDMYTEHPGVLQDRLIGNVIAEINLPSYTLQMTIVGFENHGGRTFLGNSATPLATVIKGFGNNGKDKSEGVIRNNAIGTYLHGPLLPKNPHLADWLIKTALQLKYNTQVTLSEIENALENEAKATIAKRLGIGYNRLHEA